MTIDIWLNGKHELSLKEENDDAYFEIKVEKGFKRDLQILLSPDDTGEGVRVRRPTLHSGERTTKQVEKVLKRKD